MIQKNYFNIEEFLIDKNAGLPFHVVNKIITYHLPVLNSLRERLGMPVVISKRSGYRSKAWEIARGRSGDGEHTFKGKGAVDLTCDDLQALWDMLKLSEYTRVCLYPKKKFVHCDFKSVTKQIFVDESDGNGWRLDKKI